MFSSHQIPMRQDGAQIRDFCESKIGSYQTGAAYYELTKPEDIQFHKAVVVENIHSGKRYSGPAARNLLGLPPTGTIRVRPGDHGSFKIFVQSTSVNRKLVGGTTLLYYRGGGIAAGM